MVHGPKEKRERSLGERLHLKGQRCDSPKCAAVRKPYKPGAHGQGGRRARMPSDFARQLNEKQKFKVVYGLNERTLRRLFEEAAESKTGTSMKMLELLERRLDNAVYRLGLAPSRSAARQIVNHGHVNVNGKRVRSAGYQVSAGDMIAIRQDAQTKSFFKELPQNLEKFTPPEWLSLDAKAYEGKVLKSPVEESPFEINLLVESFSK
ncbi:MAG: 30S ribosomal protein S4 [Candidatus Liptonbacteria bacterium RIFCSPHIGHO2_01_FULL_57_28]|uniref:Small ribosomal subunit protein uS4 n=1 Tax=Candidatus Liptonbacteria bacterium RIFCSPHIGHO2_01_FULL_57_28 TaxID=1798647 RepID=A0A1G2CAU9_9BACT|nr:MAG: 30S ribosomal protein S4 [Candidatus Liptonbacteria bacterium RIFCSPHIGHO2_01_FULL_57_28]